MFETRKMKKKKEEKNTEENNKNIFLKNLKF